MARLGETDKQGIDRWLDSHKRREEGFAQELVAFLTAQKILVVRESQSIGILKPADANRILPTGQWDRRLMELGNKHIFRGMVRGAQLALSAYAVKRKRLLKERAVVKAATGSLPPAPDPLIQPSSVAQAGIDQEIAESYSQPYWNQVNQTTRNGLQKYIGDGIAQNLSGADIAGIIQADPSGLFGKARAMRIARTETTAALNSGHYAVSKELTAAVGSGHAGREWLAIIDKDTRGSHWSADGQVVKTNEKFKVGNSEARFPGDPKLPPSEKINCRCTTTDVIDPDKIEDIPAGSTSAMNDVASTTGENERKPVKPRIVSFDAGDSIIEAGKSTTISWHVVDAKTVVVKPLTGVQPLHGMEVVSPKKTMKYTLTAKGPGGTRTKTITITVQQPAKPTVPKPSAKPGKPTPPPEPVPTPTAAVKPSHWTKTQYNKAQRYADKMGVPLDDDFVAMMDGPLERSLKMFIETPANFKKAESLGMSPMDYFAMKAYQGSNYREMNYIARFGKPEFKIRVPRGSSQDVADRTARHVQAYKAINRRMDEAMAKLSEDAPDEIYRGLRLQRSNPEHQKLLSLKKGDSFADDAAFSTTTDRNVLKQFAEPESIDDVGVEIIVKGKGMKGVNMQKIEALGEEEFLLPPGSKWDVIDVQDVASDKRIITVAPKGKSASAGRSVAEPAKPSHWAAKELDEARDYASQMGAAFDDDWIAMMDSPAVNASIKGFARNPKNIERAAELGVEPVELMSAKVYQGAAYSDMNHVARFGRLEYGASPPPGSTQSAADRVAKQVQAYRSMNKHMAKAVEKTGVSPPAELHRGMTLLKTTDEHQAILALKKGDTFTDTAAFSTTTDKSIVNNFARSRNENQVAVEIVVKGKSKAMDMNKIAGGNLAEEKEMLFAPGRKWRVVEIDNTPSPGTINRMVMTIEEVL